MDVRPHTCVSLVRIRNRVILSVTALLFSLFPLRLFPLLHRASNLRLALNYFCLTAFSLSMLRVVNTSNYTLPFILTRR